jgi:hypothetical protein
MGATELPRHLEPSGPDPFIADLPTALFDLGWSPAVPALGDPSPQNGDPEPPSPPIAQMDA